jgi:hypothetical protein
MDDLCGDYGVAELRKALELDVQELLEKEPCRKPNMRTASAGEREL